MNQLLKNCDNHLMKTYSFKKSSFILLAVGLLSFSSIYSQTTSFKDSQGLDSTKKANAVLLIADSSKMFTSLLASTVSSNSMSFAMNAEAKYFVDDYIKKHTAYFNNMKIWGKPYFDLYDRILTSYGIPVQLKYLSVIESSLSSTAISWAGAVGPWQIMAATAQEHGLKANYYADDRFDYVKSTNAACKILKLLYNNYNDWLLVIAAYNAGAGSVNRAISKARSKNFWDIQYYLPLETRNHVKKFIATHYYFEGDGSIATGTGNNANNALQNKDSYLDVAANSASINIYGKFNSVVIANTLMMDISLFNQLNPNLDNVLGKGDIYPLRIPADKVELFQSKKIDMLKQSVELLLSSSGPSTSSSK
jgi:membrane-bound lytic murein transglycosylase D